ncbi:MAG: sodium:proton antiporter NhaD, partial [Pseudomonadales bacterium]|nr:sodium:proton antiporter NhaD [Pseudomonadales bacterium]
MDLTTHWVGVASIAIFVFAYGVVIVEEFTHLRKSKPVMLAAGIIWALIGYQYAGVGPGHEAEEAVKRFLVEFAELFLFLLAAMTYVNAMSERNVFEALRSWLTLRGFSYQRLFWITGFLAFFLSPIIDNLTTALVTCAVIMAVGRDNKRFIGIGCINIVVAANAGGAFSPFGDVTTLMVWQSGVLPFQTFFLLFLPSLVNFLVPAGCMYLALPKGSPTVADRQIPMKRGARSIVGLFGCTIVTAVSFHQFLHLPPFLGMMTGLAYLKLFGYYLRKTHLPLSTDTPGYGNVGEVEPFDSFREVARAEWDTLLFFFGVIMCVGGLGFIGYLDKLSVWLYEGLGPLYANSLVGVLSAIVDNIPVMVAV